VEGASPIFQCAEIRENNILVEKDNLPDSFGKCPCLIKVVMLEAEAQMRLKAYAGIGYPYYFDVIVYNRN